MKRRPRVQFEWREPAGYCRAACAMRVALRAWWAGPVAVLVNTAMFLCIWLLARYSHKSDAKPPLPFVEAFALMVGCSILIVGITRWGTRHERSRVKVYDHGIGTGEPEKIPKFADIRGFSVHDYDGFRVLALELPSRQMLFGLPLEIDVAYLARFFAERGVPRVESFSAMQQSRQRGGGLSAFDVFGRSERADGA